MLENQLANMSMNSNEGLIKSLQDELAQWKQKYEALAKLYAQLRKEHLDLLNKFKEIKEGSGKQADEVRKDLEKAREELKVCCRMCEGVCVLFWFVKIVYRLFPNLLFHIYI